MNKLIDENGVLNIENLLINNNSLKEILYDGIVTEKEREEQTNRVIDVLHRIEERLSDRDVELVRELMSEMTALLIICQMDQQQFER